MQSCKKKRSGNVFSNRKKIQTLPSQTEILGFISQDLFEDFTDYSKTKTSVHTERG
jgi:hypothetical protein